MGSGVGNGPKSHGAIDVNNTPAKRALGRYSCAGTGREMADFDCFCVLAGFKRNAEFVSRF